MPDLGSDAGQSEIDAAIARAGAELVIVDNCSTLIRSGKENEGDSWLPVQSWALAHRRAGRSIVFVHHDGKGGQQRGTSRREDVLDTVIGLRRPDDYRSDQGARFEIVFEKARGFYGDGAQSFEAKYETRDKAAFWARTELTDAELKRVVDAIREGMSVREAADELGMSKSKVGRPAIKPGKKACSMAEAPVACTAVPLSHSLGAGTLGRQPLGRNNAGTSAGTIDLKALARLVLARDSRRDRTGTRCPTTVPPRARRWDSLDRASLPLIPG